VNTFIPYPDFRASLEALDDPRLGKQRLECLQILKALAGETKGWRNHPATVMWRMNQDALCHYAMMTSTVWMERGFKDTLHDQFFERLKNKEKFFYPTWWGSFRVHSSHRANLIRKGINHGWTEQPVDGYFWPNFDYSWRRMLDDRLDPYGRLTALGEVQMVDEARLPRRQS